MSEEDHKTCPEVRRVLLALVMELPIDQVIKVLAAVMKLREEQHA